MYSKLYSSSLYSDMIEFPCVYCDDRDKIIFNRVRNEEMDEDDWQIIVELYFDFSGFPKKYMINYIYDFLRDYKREDYFSCCNIILNKHQIKDMLYFLFKYVNQIDKKRIQAQDVTVPKIIYEKLRKTFIRKPDIEDPEFIICTGNDSDNLVIYRYKNEKEYNVAVHCEGLMGFMDRLDKTIGFLRGHTKWPLANGSVILNSSNMVYLVTELERDYLKLTGSDMNE